MLIPAAPSPLVTHWFHLYTRRYLRKRFHAIHVTGEFGPDPIESRPLVLCMNHSSWWDVMLGFYLSTEMFDRPQYGVMDARQLLRYRFFTRLGMIGVDRESLTGIKEFLTYLQCTLQNRRCALWLTPQGEMVSNTARPVRFQPGLGHLVTTLSPLSVATVVVHYEFWEEPLPEAFVSLSPPHPVDATSLDFDRKSFLHAQERKMESQLDGLMALVRTRDRNRFTGHLEGAKGVSPTYDALRAVGARLRREKFTSEHGGVTTPRWRRRPRE